MITPDGFVMIFADHDGDRIRHLSPTFHRFPTMAKGNEAADILAFANVQHAIGDLIQQVARESGIADKHASRMRIQIVDRISSGSPVEPAIALVDAILAARPPAPKVEGGETGRTLERNKGLK
jgi:hypothetical protein